MYAAAAVGCGHVFIVYHSCPSINASWPRACGHVYVAVYGHVYACSTLQLHCMYKKPKVHVCWYNILVGQSRTACMPNQDHSLLASEHGDATCIVFADFFGTTFVSKWLHCFLTVFLWLHSCLLGRFRLSWQTFSSKHYLGTCKHLCLMNRQGVTCCLTCACMCHWC